MPETSIEWTDRSVNPIRARHKKTGAVGHYCEKISSGCANCYSSNFQPRFHMPTFGGVRKYPNPPTDDCETVSVNEDIELFFDEERLQEVLRRKKPTKWFWCDMTDMFGAWVPDAWIDKCFAVMALTPHHTHQVLTKRPERMTEYLRTLQAAGGPSDIWEHLAFAARNLPLDAGSFTPRHQQAFEWPLPKLWLGTSAENQKTADERIPHLLKCPAAVRFLSVEPLLEEIKFKEGFRSKIVRDVAIAEGIPLIHWVIVGAESGRGARPCSMGWIRSVVAQCKEANTPVFVKQLGAVPVAETIDDCVYMPFKNRKGSDPAEWPESLRIRQMPEVRL